MKAKKTNLLQEEADKIEHIPEEKNNGHDGQDKPIKSKKPRKNRFLVGLRNTWARITGCIRSCTSIQVERSAEEFPTPNGLNMEEKLPKPSGIIMEEKLPTPSKIIMEELPEHIGINMEEELLEPSGTNMGEELQLSRINMEEELQGPNDINMEEKLPEPIGINMEGELLEPSGTNMEEELTVSSINMKDSKANGSSKEQEKEDDVAENQNIETNNKEAQLVPDRFVEREIQAEHQCLNDLIHSLQDKLAEYSHINDQIQSLEDLYIQHYNAENEQQAGEEQQSKAEDNEVKIKEVGEDRESIKDSQRASCEMPGPSDINNTDNESSKGKGKDDDKGENASICINTEREECRSEELHKSTFQSGSSYDKKPTPSNICIEKPEQTGEETPATVPLTIQSFTVHQILGEGGFGDVYLARDIIRKECVAIKAISKWYFTNYGGSFVERNILELSYESPHLIHGLAAFHTKKFIFYVMELAPRGDLHHFLQKNRELDHPTIQFIIAEVICGTQFLHKKGIIHRDLKPENILLSADGHVKITDFGLAAMSVYERTKGGCVGTVNYMAPEMVRRQEHGEGVDYFAIGVILYKMHTSRSPFSGQTPKEVKLAILRYEPKYPEYLTPDTLNILQGLLHKKQHHRLGVEGDVRNHPYFSNINWEDMEAGRVIPPEIMTEASVDQNMNQTLSYTERANKISSKDQKIFKEFNFICPEWSQHYHPAETIETKSWMANLFARRPFKKEAN